MEMTTCDRCGGSGIVIEPVLQERQTCDQCQGAGTLQCLIAFPTVWIVMGASRDYPAWPESVWTTRAAAEAERNRLVKADQTKRGGGAFSPLSRHAYTYTIEEFDLNPER